MLDCSCASVRLVFLVSDSSVLFISGGICAIKGFGLRVVRCSCTKIEWIILIFVLTVSCVVWIEGVSMFVMYELSLSKMVCFMCLGHWLCVVSS